MHTFKKVFIVSLMSTFLFSCSKGQELSLEERLHAAYLDSIEATSEKIRPLVCLNKDDPQTIWKDDRVLLFTFHRYPDSYHDGEEVTFTWSESWVCSVKEYATWYKNNKDNIKDILLRTKQVLGMDSNSANTYISSLWFNPNDLQRPAYITDANKQMSLAFSEDETDEYKTWFQGQYYYSYDVKHLPWTRLGYTYDWSKEAKDRYGLSEFIAWKGTTVTVDKTMLVNDFVNYITATY